MWSKIHEAIAPYLVRIETPDGTGSGFLFAYNATKELAAIATAAHVVDEAESWKKPIKLIHDKTRSELFLQDGRRAILLDKDRDSASIVIPAGALPFPAETLPLMDPEHFMPVGVPVGWLGFPAVAYPQLCFFAGTISAFLIEDDCYLIDGVAIAGVSGGPVFAYHTGDVPEIIGSVSAYMPNRVGGATLPGLLRAQDITAFDAAIETMKSIEDAITRKKNTKRRKGSAAEEFNRRVSEEVDDDDMFSS